MLRTIKLKGRLARLHSEPIEFEVDSVAETVRALSYQLDGFREMLGEGHYRVSLISDELEEAIDENMVPFSLGERVKEIHFEPVLEGSKGGGGKILAGIALVALSFAIPGAVGLLGPQVPGLFGANLITSSFVAKIGIAMALGGVAQMFAPEVKSQDNSFERPEEKPSFLFNGAKNTVEQGGPVPLVYGQIRTGSTVVSTGLTTENLSDDL